MRLGSALEATACALIISPEVRTTPLARPSSTGICSISALVLIFAPRASADAAMA